MAIEAQSLDARFCLQHGLANKLEPKQTALDTTLEWATQLAKRSPLDTWELSLWGKNLTDETYQLHRIAGPDEGTETASIYGIPRHYGASVSYQF